jgi:hypothetical protein
MRLVLSVLVAAAVASPAVAALAPEYYEAARKNAPDVVVFKVEKVEAVRPASGRGECKVSGKVEAVERGAHYRVGGPITVAVPCIWPNAEMMAGPVMWQTPAGLKASKRGRAWMKAPGQLALYQYERLS